MRRNRSVWDHARILGTFVRGAVRWLLSIIKRVTCQQERSPRVPETFSNLFNLGTRCVSESYLRECEIKQSDKQTRLFSFAKEQEQRSCGWYVVGFSPTPPLYIYPFTTPFSLFSTSTKRALMCVHNTIASHSKCLWGESLSLFFSFQSQWMHEHQATPVLSLVYFQVG